MENSFLQSAIRQFRYYKDLGDKTMQQLSDEQLLYKPSAESNSIITIVKHLHGNMMSRWTDFLTTDGEKAWRTRDAEFEDEVLDRKGLLELWESGWNCLFGALSQLSDHDLEKIIYIRNQGHTVMEAINRQLAHYPYHVGQMVFIGKMLADEAWQSLSIPKNKSDQFNAEKFSQEKRREHFTDETLNKKK